MTILDNGTRNQYSAAALQTVFAYTFEIFDKGDIAVEKNGALLSEGTHYTVSNIGNDNGGNVTLITGAASGDVITLYRDMSLERITDYQQNGDYLANEVNDDLDRLWAALQQNKNLLIRSIRATIDDSVLNSSNTELADPLTRANKALGFNSSGELDYLSGVSSVVGTLREYSTIAAVIADIASISIGDVLIVKERSTGNGGGATWDAVDATLVTENEYDIVTGDVIVSLVLRAGESASVRSFGADGTADDTDEIARNLDTSLRTLFDVDATPYSVTTISLTTSVDMINPDIEFSGLNAGFTIDALITGFKITGGNLIGDGVLLNDHKGIASAFAIERGYFSNNYIFEFVQGFDLHDAINTVFVSNIVVGSVGEASGEGYGVIAGSSERGVFNGNIFELCQRHALYFNNALYTTALGNVFYKHRDGLATGGGLGALQIAGQAKAVTALGNSFGECTGPEIVISPQPTNTSPLKCIPIVGNAHYNGQSSSIRIGGATPSANELPVGIGVIGEVFMPDNSFDGSLVQVYSGFGINISNNTWYLKDGLGTTAIGIALGLTTPDDAFFDNISICNNNGVFTKNAGNTIFVSIASELCLGTTRIDIFDNHVETDILIDYETTPTNPNIRTDDIAVKNLALAAGNNDINIAGYNIFSITGDVGGNSDIINMNNGYVGKVIELRFADNNTVDVQRTNASLAGGVKFTATNKDRLFLKYNGTNWDEIGRSVNN